MDKHRGAPPFACSSYTRNNLVREEPRFEMCGKLHGAWGVRALWRDCAQSSCQRYISFTTRMLQQKTWLDGQEVFCELNELLTDQSFVKSCLLVNIIDKRQRLLCTWSWQAPRLQALEHLTPPNTLSWAYLVINFITWYI